MKKNCIILVAIMSAACLFCGCSKTAASGADTGAVEKVMDIATTQYFTDEEVSDEDLEKILLAGSNAPSAMNGQPWHFSVITDDSVLQQISEGMSFGGGMPGGAMPGGDMPEGFMPADEMPADMERPMPADMDFPDDAGELPENFKEGELPEGFNPDELPEDFDPANGEIPTPPEGFGGGAPAAGGISKAGLTDAPVAIVISCTNGSDLDAGLACQNMSVTAQLLGYGTKIISSPTMALNGEKQSEYRELLGIPENQSAVAILLIGMEDTSVDESVDGYTGASERNPLNEVVTYVTGK